MLILSFSAYVAMTRQIIGTVKYKSMYKYKCYNANIEESIVIVDHQTNSKDSYTTVRLDLPLCV